MIGPVMNALLCLAVAGEPAASKEIHQLLADQVAAWNEMNLRWIDQNLGSFKGRAVRDDWISQSKKLATGWRPR